MQFGRLGFGFSRLGWPSGGSWYGSTAYFVIDAMRNRAMVRTGAATGPELVTNGDFALDPVNASQNTIQNGWKWSRGGGSIVPVWSDGVVSLTGDGSNQIRIFADFTTTVGQLYELSFTIGVNTGELIVGTTLGGGEILGVSPPVGGNTYRFIARTTTTYVRFWRTAATQSTVDNVSCKAVLPGPVVAGTVQSLIDAGRMTYSRVDSGAYAQKKDGSWQSFASGVPRITDLGITIEPSTTNSLSNNSMQGAVAGTPGTYPTGWGTPVSAMQASGLTVQLVSVFTENGIDFLRFKITGTTSSASSSNFTTGFPAAAQNQTWVASYFLRLFAGSTSGFSILGVRARTLTAGFSSTADGTNNVVSSLNSSIQRFSQAVTSPADGGNVTTQGSAYLQFNWNNSAAIDITLDIGWPQWEQSAVATTPIRTTSGAVVRAADDYRIPTANLYIPGDGTLVGEFTSYYTQDAATVDRSLLSIDGTGNSRLMVRASSANGRAPEITIGDGSAVSTVRPTSAVGANAVGRLAGIYQSAVASARMSYSGAAIVSTARVCVIDVPTNIGVGGSGTGTSDAFMYGTIRYLAGLSKVMSDAELQTESARYA